MGVIARVVGVAACGLSLAVLAAAPTAGAEPTGALPPRHPAAADRSSATVTPRCDSGSHSSCLASEIPPSRRLTARTRLNSSRPQPLSRTAMWRRCSCRCSGCWAANRTQPARGPASGRAPTGEPTGNGEARCWSSPRAPFPTSTPSRPASSPVGARPRRARRLRCATTVGPTRRSPTPAAAKRAISSCWPARPRTSAVRPTRTTEPPRAHGRASRPADRGGPLVGPYGPPGRSQNATHNAQAGIDTHCSCPSAVRSQYIGPGFPQSFAPSGEHG